ncbi:unnamed protein product [Phaedon cochleariae]|uniref:Uncharacterized protein n=1 Tax=Phaedon cochleariae TaxID=80249 RepID=A0A9N9SDK3_PHACE|nr:unnamed protein product [Phaedon cochleariae]
MVDILRSTRALPEPRQVGAFREGWGDIPRGGVANRSRAIPRRSADPATLHVLCHSYPRTFHSKSCIREREFLCFHPVTVQVNNNNYCCDRRAFGDFFSRPIGLHSFTTLEHLRPIVASITTLIGNCDTMEATYCVGTDVDVCRMFDQYLYKVRRIVGSGCPVVFDTRLLLTGSFA